MTSGRVRCGAAAVVLLLAGCESTPSINRPAPSGTGTASTADGVQTITIDVDNSYRFKPSTIIVHQGMVRVVLVHTGDGAPHDFSLLGFPADFVPLASAGETKEAMFATPSPGKYEFVCTIHTAQGQTGTLVVE